MRAFAITLPYIEASMLLCLGFDWQSNMAILGLQINEERHL